MQRLRWGWGLVVGVGAVSGLVALDASSSSCSSDSFAPPVVTYCAAHPNAVGMFCDDFEKTAADGSAFDPTWSLAATGGGVVTREAVTTGTVAGFALHSVVPGSTAKRGAQLVWDPNVAIARHLVISGKVKLSAECAAGHSIFALSGFSGSGLAGILAGVVTDTASKKSLLYLFLGAQTDGGLVSTTLMGTDDVVFGSWTDVIMELTFDRPRDAAAGGGVDVIVSMGGKKQIEVLGGEGGAAIAFPKLAIGASTTSTPLSCDSWFDDVTLEATK